MNEFDPVEYGKLLHAVEQLEERVGYMEKDIKQLLELANRSKGSLWTLMALTSAISVVVGWIIHSLMGK